MSVKLPTAEQWMEVFKQAGVDTDGLAAKNKAELESYGVSKTGDPIHVNIDRVAQIIRDSMAGAQQLQAIGALAATELKDLVLTGKSKVKKRGTRLA